MSISAYAGAYVVLFLIGFGFGIAPFVGDFRRLPRWMHIALHMVGVCWFGGAAFGVALNFAASRLHSATYQLLWVHKILIFGMGAGIFLLLIFSGILKALADLHAAKKRGLPLEHE